MTPEEQRELTVCVNRISALLHQEAQAQGLPMNTLAELESTVRQQLQTHVSPSVGLFLSTQLARRSLGHTDAP